MKKIIKISAMTGVLVNLWVIVSAAEMGSLNSGSMESFNGNAGAADDFGLGAMETIQQKQENAVAALNLVNSMRQEQRILNVAAKVNGDFRSFNFNKEAAPGAKIDNPVSAGTSDNSPKAKAFGLFSLEGTDPGDPQFTQLQAELQEESEENIKEIEKVNKKNRAIKEKGDGSGDSESGDGESGSAGSGSGGN